MVTKKKPVKPSTTKVLDPAEALDERLSEIGMVLRRIATVLEKMAAGPIMRTGGEPINEIATTSGAQRVVIGAPTRQGPDGVLEHFLDGQWHRRSGDVYAKVAEPGSPNAGETESDEQTS